MFKFSNRRRLIKTCPCGKSNRDGKFSPYLLEGEPSPIYGFCHACGETFLPPLEREETGFKNNITCLKRPIETSMKRSIETMKRIEPGIVNSTLKAYHLNNFAQWLAKIAPEQSQDLLRYFCIGTAKDGGTLFWNINIHQEATTVKKVYYHPDGHRNKEKLPEYLYKKADGYQPCLFGEFQLLERHGDAIILVESEKTAVIGTSFLPGFIWIATGGANGLTEEKAKVLENGRVIILYDCDKGGRNGAIRAEKILKAIHCNVKVEELDALLNDGTDVVDFIIQS